MVQALGPLIDAYEGFADVPFPGLYVELERTYPESKFILVSRNLQDWWSSLIRHWQWNKSPRTHTFGNYEYIQYNRYTTTPLCSVDLGDRDILIDLHVQHLASVRAHFAGHPGRLLEVNVEDPEIGARIAAFAGRTETTPYPHVGATKDRN